MVGGTSLAARNVISANGVDGVIIDLGSTANSVEGNDIGTDVTGSHALGNSYGVVIQRGSVANTVGGTTAGARNVISANKTSGVYITDYATEYNIVEGNYIGTDSTGTANLGNLGDGVDVVRGAEITTIGGTTTSAANLIKFNHGNGVLISGVTTYDTIVESDTINANGGNGVYVYQAAASSILGCTIENNQGWGILISGTSTTYYAYNTIVGNHAGSVGTS